jgi:phytoene synthase
VSTAVTTLDESYQRARELAKAFGRPYYVSTLALGRVKRHHAQALYGFFRYASDVVTAVPVTNVHGREQVIHDLGTQLFNDLAAGSSDDPVLKAVVHTARSFDLDPDCFRRFLRAMTNSLTVTSYDTFEDLLDHLDGSAAVVGELLLPILEPRSPSALPYARDIAVACRLTECWSDVGRDLERGRVYVPQDDLRHFGADPWLRRVTPEWRSLIAFEIRRTRDYFTSGERIAAELPPASARCALIICDLQRELLDRIDDVGSDVFSARPRVPGWRTAGVAVRRSLRSTDAGRQ